MDTDKSTTESGCSCITPPACPPSGTALPPGGDNCCRPGSKKALALIGIIIALFGALCLMQAGNKETTVEATYNAEAVQAQGRIAAWLGEPDTAEREMLRSWLAERGNEGPEALWLTSASQEELDAAIDDLCIPECN